MEDFVGLLHLDSNVIDDRCDNTQASFKNYTSSTYRYSDDKYEAGLLEFHLPFTWINVKANQYICLLDSTSQALVRNGLIKIESGYYASVQALIDKCNVAISEKLYSERLTDFFVDSTPPPAIFYNEPFQRVVVDVPFGNGKIERSGAVDLLNRSISKVSVFFTTQLASIFGFTVGCIEYMRVDTQLTLAQTAELNERKAKIFQQHPNLIKMAEMAFSVDLPVGTEVAKNPNDLHFITFFQDKFVETPKVYEIAALGIAQRPPKIDLILEELFIYCSLIKPHAIGNQYKQILRVTPVYDSERRGDPIVTKYDRPFFYPLYHSSFDYVEIELRDRAGELIEFESGSVVAIIEIRRRKHAE